MLYCFKNPGAYQDSCKGGHEALPKKPILIILKAFFIFWGFIITPVQALNPMCYSPVQMAALMSPNRPKPPPSQTKIKQLEKGIEKYEEALDEKEDRLAESLNADKLGEDPYNTASAIRDYIEEFQDGWPCANSKGGFSFNRTAFWQSLPLNTFLPYAYADIVVVSNEGKGSVESDGGTEINFLDMISDTALETEKEENCIDRGGTQEGESCICKGTEGKIIDKDSGICRDLTDADRETYCTGRGGDWVSNEKKCWCRVSRGKVYESAQNNCREKTAKEKCSKHGTWSNNTCECKEDHKWDGSTCIPMTKQDKCVNKGEPWEWDPSISKCINKKVKCEKQEGDWTWSNNTCECKEPKFDIEGNCREKTEKEQCTAQGKVLVEDSCITKEEQACKNKSGQWEWKDETCTCPEPKKQEGETCRDKSSLEKQEEQCNTQGGTWTGRTCDCKEDHKWTGSKCVEMTQEEKDEKKCRETAGKSWVDGACIDCPDWKQDPSFKSNGKVDGKFCDRYAKDKRQCKEALSKLQRLAKTLEKYRDRLESAEEESEKEEEPTEAGGLCFECLKRELVANQPSAGQNFGNMLSMFAGAGMSYLGYRMGQSAQNQTHMLRVQEGYPVQQNYFALNGASAGFPFLSQGIYGLTRTNTPTGGWVCTPSLSPHGGAYNYGMNYGYSMPYF